MGRAGWGAVLVFAGCVGRLDAPTAPPPPEHAVLVDLPRPPTSTPIEPTPRPGHVRSDGGVSAPAEETDAGVSEAPVFGPAGLRRLTRLELALGASSLLGLDAGALADALGDDLRQSGFTRNADQRVTAEQAEALRLASSTLAHEAVTQRLTTLAPCPAGTPVERCAQAFVEGFGTRAFRRALSTPERDALLTVYRAGALDAGYADGVELVVTAVLQSASFLYLTELGTPEAPEQLSGEELAAQLASLCTGLPPSEALLAAGRAGQLANGEVRASVARELLGTPAGRQQLQRLVLEWLSTDAVEDAPKDAQVFPEWEAVRADVRAESAAIVDHVLFAGAGTLEALLSTPETDVTPALAGFYGLTSAGPQLQPPWRRGLLLAGGFPAAVANPDGTAPVRRGARVRRKLLCQELPLPSGEGVNLIVPPPDPTLTTRQRFAVHTSSGACAGCHVLLDPIGFAFENFDAVGRYRTTENGLPIDATGELVMAGDANGVFTDAVGLVALLSRSQSVRECFERHLVRFALGRSGDAEERTFVDFVRTRDSGQQGLVVELLLDFVRSEQFLRRRLTP